MNKCPRCGNEKLKEDYNYCPICGAILDYEMAEGALQILNTLLDSYKTYECENAEEENYRELVVGALGIGISELEKTAQEVPVQEQLKTLEFINKEFDINLSQKQYDDIAIFDFCTQKYTAYEILRLLKLLDII